jgi:flagellar biosynthesis protein FlhA
VPAFESESGVLKAITLDPRIEQLLGGKVQRSAFDLTLTLEPALAQYLLNELNNRVREMTEKGLLPLLVVTTEIRLAFKRFFEPSLPRLAILSYQELPARTEIQNFAIIMAPNGLGRRVPEAAMAEPQTVAA